MGLAFIFQSGKNYSIATVGHVGGYSKKKEKKQTNFFSKTLFYCFTLVVRDLEDRKSENKEEKK